jgi:hypothetical protein
MFGLSYSAVSRRGGLFKAKLQENRALQRKFGQFKSKINGLLPKAIFLS